METEGEEKEKAVEEVAEEIAEDEEEEEEDSTYFGLPHFIQVPSAG